jgi:hypothetical protein
LRKFHGIEELPYGFMHKREYYANMPSRNIKNCVCCNRIEKISECIKILMGTHRCTNCVQCLLINHPSRLRKILNEKIQYFCSLCVSIKRLKQSEMRKLLCATSDEIVNWICRNLISQLHIQHEKKENMEIWYIRQIWIHLVSYVHIHHRIESVHKIAIDSICSKIQFRLFFSFCSTDNNRTRREIQMVTLFSCLLFIMNLNRFFMYAQVSLIDGKFITMETIRYGSNRRVTKGMEKNSIILFFRQCPFNICQQLPRYDSTI